MKGLEAGGGGGSGGGSGDGGGGALTACKPGNDSSLSRVVLANVHGLDETRVSANFRISSRIMLITKHGVATTSVLPRAPRCFDDRRRAASSVISSRRERVRKNRAGMDGTRSAGGGDTTTRATSSGRNRFIRHSTARRSALLSDETRSIHGTN